MARRVTPYWACFQEELILNAKVFHMYHPAAFKGPEISSANQDAKQAGRTGRETSNRKREPVFLALPTPAPPQFLQTTLPQLHS